MPTFHELCSPLHQGEEQPDIELFRSFLLYITLFVGVMKGKKRIVGGKREKGEIDQSLITGRIVFHILFM